MFDTQKKDDKEKTETISLLLPCDQSCQRRDAGGERRGGGVRPPPPFPSVFVRSLNPIPTR